jgi:hypothetical protein
VLASITPLGERGRQARWGVTVTAFLLGATAAGAAFGAACGALGGAVVAGGGGSDPRLAVLAAALAVAIGLDILPWRIPGPRRQVNERWLDEYRGWVYGLGYGGQLGLAVVTVVSSAATYVALIAAVLTANAAAGAVVVGCYGLVRGLTPLFAARVRTPRELVALHASMARWRSAARWGGVAGLGAVLVAALAGSAA